MWRQLEAAVTQRNHGWRVPVLATTDGRWADARTVVLREAVLANRRLVFYTDRRSPKLAQLTSHPDGTLVMWCSALGWQLRCKVRLVLQAPGPATMLRWARIEQSASAQDYLSPLPPGSPLGAELAGPAELAELAELAESPASPALPTPPTSQGMTKHENFAVVNAAVVSLDWLELHRDGHRRALFDDQAPRWVQP